MHPPEPIYPCYLPVLGEFNRMTPHEGPSMSLPDDLVRPESSAGVARLAQERCPFTSQLINAGSSYGWAERRAETTASSSSASTTHSILISATCSPWPSVPMKGRDPARGVKRPVPGDVNAQCE